MGRARDAFSASRLCESTADVAQKPALIRSIIQNTKTQADIQEGYPQEVPYEERLRFVLEKVPAADLRVLISARVTVCLDQRLSRCETFFTDRDIGAIFYNTPNGRVLSLRDDGEDPSRMAVLNSRLVHFNDEAIEELVYKMQNERNLPALLVGSGRSENNADVFVWEEKKDFSSELDRNPDLLTPPLKPGASLKPDPGIKL